MTGLLWTCATLRRAAAKVTVANGGIRVTRTATNPSGEGMTMRLQLAAALGVGVIALGAPVAAPAHFILMQPNSWLVENQLGAPQIAGPCGGTTANPGTPTRAITELTSGTMLHIDVKVSNINCDHCTFQIIQFMEEHGVNPDGRFTYHHCADAKITANPKLPIDKVWPGQTKGKKPKKAKT